MDRVDVLIVAALPMEFDAARAQVPEWTPADPDGSHPYLRGEYRCADGRRLAVALARPTRMSGRHTGPLATTLAGKLRPDCLAMPGVCAGNPAEVALGDVVVAEMTYEYDEGKLTADGFVGDHRQYQLDDRWVRAAQDLDPSGLPGYGPASEAEAANWLLERLYLGQEPAKHPAFRSYFPAGAWQPRTAAVEARGHIARAGAGWVLSEAGRAHIERVRYDDVYGPERLPFAVAVAPMASGSYVAKDGEHWRRLAAMGVRSVTGLDMEAATIATVAHTQRVPHWLVAKGVMDHADPEKDDRYKGFAARASAQVLFALLDRLAGRSPGSPEQSRAESRSIRLDNARGVQIGDHNTQHNTFSG
jgi:nucleoside phosphorylase